MRNLKGPLLASVYCFGALAASAASAFAGEGEATAAGAAAEVSDPAAGEIVVTARRRAESLQDVPVAITVLTREQLQNQGIDSLGKIAGQVPNVAFDNALNLGQNFLTIRGVTQMQLSPPPAAIVVDGVLQISPQQFNVNEFDLEQIEVLKGPQGALYGRNAIAGAINISTQKPDDEWSGGALVRYGRGDDYTLQAAVGGPLVPGKVFARTGISYSKRSGQLLNPTTDRFVDHYEDLSFQNRIVILPTDAFELDLKYRYSDSKGADPAYVISLSGDPRDEKGSVIANFVGSNPRKLHEASARASYDASFATIAVTLAYAHIDETVFSDFDFTPDDILRVRQDQVEEGLSQEIRVTSNGTGPLRWLVGGYHVRNERMLGQTGFIDPGLFCLFDPSFPCAPTGVADFIFLENQDVNLLNNWAGFAQLEYDLSDQFEIAGALRYDHDRLSQVSLTTAGERKAAFKKWQPKLTFTYKPNRDLSLYASYGVGFRSGDFNPTAATIGTAVSRAESGTTYEVGVKSRLFDHRVRLNAAAFYMDDKNAQVKVLDFATGSNVGINLDKVRIKGFEIEASARLASWLSISGGFGYTDAKVKRAVDYLQAVGKVPIRVPKYTINFGADLTHPVSEDINFFFRPDYRRMGKSYWDFINLQARQPSDYLDLRAGFAGQDTRWTVTGWIRNALDDRTTQDFQPASQSGSATDLYFPAIGRTYGIEVSYRF